MRIAVSDPGAMGRWAAKELAISPEVDAIVVGDCVEPWPAPRLRGPARPGTARSPR
jgi:hypothetical protein